MRPRDARLHLADVLAAGELIGSFVHDRTFAEYGADALVSSAVERQLEIVGEALNRALSVDSTLAERLPQARQSIGLRNILAHGYDRVSDALVWSIVTESLPGLLAEVRSLLEV